MEDGGVGDDGVGGEGCAAPREDVAWVGEGVARGGAADVEAEGAQGVAAEGGGVQEVAIGAGEGVGCAFETVCLVVADGDGEGVVEGWGDVEGHGNDAVGTEGVDEGVEEGAGGVEGAVVPLEGEEGLADGGVEGGAVVPEDVEGV